MTPNHNTRIISVEEKDLTILEIMILINYLLSLPQAVPLFLTPHEHPHNKRT